MNLSHLAKGILQKLFPSLSYRGFVKKQLKIYREIQRQASILNQAELAKGEIKPAIGVEKIIEQLEEHSVDPESLQEFINVNKDNAIRQKSAKNDILNIFLRQIAITTQNHDTAPPYLELTSVTDKNLEDVICAVTEWEYLDCPRAIQIQGEMQLPERLVERFRAEIKSYVKNRVERINV